MSDDGKLVQLVDKANDPTHLDVITILEDALTHAKANKVLGLAIAFSNADGTTHTRFSIDGRPAQLVAAASYLLHRLNRWWEDN